MKIEAFKDDRSESQLQSHTWLVAGRDKYLSKFGPGKTMGGSTAAWACKPEHRHAVLSWVSNRSDMTYVRDTSLAALWKVTGLVHVYVVGDDHPALNGSE